MPWLVCVCVCKKRGGARRGKGVGGVEKLRAPGEIINTNYSTRHATQAPTEMFLWKFSFFYVKLLLKVSMINI